jgi:hypothetical protein
MADVPFIVAGIALFLGMNLIFSFHSIEEGHVGVYYRVSIYSCTVLLFFKHYHLCFVSLFVFICVTLPLEVQQGNDFFLIGRSIATEYKSAWVPYDDSVHHIPQISTSKLRSH